GCTQGTFTFSSMAGINSDCSSLKRLNNISYNRRPVDPNLKLRAPSVSYFVAPVFIIQLDNQPVSVIFDLPPLNFLNSNRFQEFRLPVSVGSCSEYIYDDFIRGQL